MMMNSGSNEMRLSLGSKEDARQKMKLESTSRLRDRFAVFALLCFLAFAGITYVRHEFGANQW
jgi:hypothetical protein